MRVLCPIRRSGRRCRSPRPHHRRKIVYCCGRSFVRTYKMSKSLQPFSPADSLAKLKKLFGPPPVLGSEDPRAYDGMLAQFLADIKPRDFIAEMWVRYATDAFWEALRYQRHKNLSVERQYREQYEMNGEHEEEAEGEHLESTPDAAIAEPDDKPNEEGEQVDHTEEVKEPGAPTTQFERILDLDAVVDTVLPDCQAIIHGPVDELEYAAALESNIAYYERLDRQYAIAMARFEDALKQLDLYQQGLGSRLHQVAGDIIDGDFTEEPVSIQGPDNGAQ